MTREILTDRRVGDKQMKDQRLGEYIVWIDAQEKIASFHNVERYDPMYFHQHEMFMSYLFALTFEQRKGCHWRWNT